MIAALFRAVDFAKPVVYVPCRAFCHMEFLTYENRRQLRIAYSPTNDRTNHTKQFNLLEFPRARFDHHVGFTLVELLVSIAIIGVLIGILLPAMSSIRESSRRTACQANLKQIGLALHAFHESKQTFPAGGIEWRSAAKPNNRQLAWSAFILPFLDEPNLYAQLDLKQAFDSETNKVGAATIIETYLCPTSARGDTLVDGRGPCDYGGIYGERITGPNDPPKGLMVYDRKFAFTDVDDGLSNTLIVAEDTGWSDGQWINGKNIFDQAYPINQAPKFENDIRSQHPGGATAVLADASVRFLAESIDAQTLAALCTRAGGEVISAGY